MHVRSRSNVVLPLAGCLLVLLAGTITAQKPDDGSRALNDRDSREVAKLRKQLFQGEIPARSEDKDHVQALDVGAMLVTFPYCWPEIRNEPGRILRVSQDLDVHLADLARNKAKNNGAATRIYCRKVIDRAQEVIETGPAISAINAARVMARLVERPAGQPREAYLEDVLPRLAEDNGDHLLNILASLVRNPKVNDGVRYYALVGLRDLLAIPPQPTTPLYRKENAESAVRAAMGIAEVRPAFPSAPTQAEIDGFRFLRREAVRVLAQFRVPAFGDKDRPALTLARIAGDDAGLAPRPRVDERVEAAIGLARMRAPQKGSDYQADYACYLIGQAVAALGKSANAEVDKKAPGRHRPWKVDAARLGEAVEEMLQENKSEYQTSLLKQCLNVLSVVEVGKDPAKANDLLEYLNSHRPKVTELFAGQADTAVKEAPATE